MKQKSCNSLESDIFKIVVKDVLKKIFLVFYTISNRILVAKYLHFYTINIRNEIAGIELQN